MKNFDDIVIATLPSIAMTARDTLPACSGVYFALSETGTVLYIGQTHNLRIRWKQHHHMSSLTSRGCVSIAWHPCSNEDMGELEWRLIRQFQPILNTLQPSPRTVSLKEKHRKRKMVYLSDLQHDAIAQVAADLAIPFAQALRRVIDDGLQAPTDRQSIPTRQRPMSQLNQETDHA
jgi:GIY-YIG catalytic domain